MHAHGPHAQPPWYHVVKLQPIVAVHSVSPPSSFCGNIWSSGYSPRKTKLFLWLQIHCDRSLRKKQWFSDNAVSKDVNWNTDTLNSQLDDWTIERIPWMNGRHFVGHLNWIVWRTDREFVGFNLSRTQELLLELVSSSFEAVRLKYGNIEYDVNQLMGGRWY